MTLETHSARLLPSVVAPPTVAFHPAGADTPGDLKRMPCPNCGSAEPKSLTLTVDIQLPDNPGRPVTRLRVLRCPACTASFYDKQVPPDYAELALNNRGRVPFYVQQGAGVSLITRPLAQLRHPPGTSYMEVGCGYGFGLDFALNTNGWTGLGIDPAPLSALGRDALNLPIELRYLRDDDEARGTVDVVLGSEVIEHVTSPSAFVRTLRAMLKPGGVLVLTTPNGDDIDPQTPPGIIIPLLSPSLHLVIQNRLSLRTLLQQAGFAHVRVDIDSHSLVAFASDAPLDLETDHHTLRHALRSHLERRARAVDPATDLFLAFAGRAFYESVNDGDMDAADRAWSLLIPAIQTRFGLDLDTIIALPPALATCSLEQMATLVPLNLGGLLYAHAIRKLAAGTGRAALEPVFVLSAQAAAAMRRALGELAMEDGQTEDIGWTSTAEAVLSAADALDPALADRLQALPPAPNGGEQRSRSIALRAMSNLVNAGHLEAGGQLVTALALDRHPFAQPAADRTEAERDALFCLAILDVQIGPNGQPLGNPAAARDRFAAVRQTCEPGTGLWWSALRGTVQALGLLNDSEAASTLVIAIDRDHPAVDTAGWALASLVNLRRYEPARGIATRSGLANAPFAAPNATNPLTEEQRGILFALAVLDAEFAPDGQPIGNLPLARARFRRLREATQPGTPLWWSVLRGEAQTMRHLNDTDGLAVLVDATLKQHPGMEAAAWAVPNLVQTSRFIEARALVAASGLATLDYARPDSASNLTDEQRAVVLSLATLDAQPDGGDLASASALFRRVRLATAPGTPDWWAALRGEEHTLGLTGNKDAIAALAGSIARDNPEIDTARWALPSLVNAGHYHAARGVAERSGLKAAAFTQPGSTRPLSAEERDLVFFLAVLDAEIGPNNRPVGEPAMARGRFARVRRASSEGSDLWLAALRGELQALDLLDVHEEAAALTRDVEAGYPDVTLPPDILARIGKG